MKKFIVLSVMALGFLSASAQKIGYISTDELIASMPETAKAESELKDYQESLVKQGQEKNQDADAKTAQFFKDSATLSPSMKEIKRGELVKLYSEVQNWQQTAQELYQQKAQEKIMPLRNKAQDAIKTVAKESGYGYVLDINALIVAPPGDDILNLVKKKLGIKDTPKTPATGTGRP